MSLGGSPAASRSDRSGSDIPASSEAKGGENGALKGIVGLWGFEVQGLGFQI